MSTPSFRLYVCHGPFCRGDMLYRAFSDAITQADLSAQCDVRASGCQGRCDDGPNVTIWPGPIRYCHLSIAHAEHIVQQHLVHHTIVTELLHPSSLRTLPE